MGEAKRRGSFAVRQERAVMRQAVFDAAQTVKRLPHFPALALEEKRELCKKFAVMLFKERMGIPDDPEREEKDDGEGRTDCGRVEAADERGA